MNFDFKKLLNRNVVMNFDFKKLLRALALQEIPFCSVRVDEYKLKLYVPSKYVASFFAVLQGFNLPGTADIHCRQNGMNFSLGGKLYFGQEIIIDVDLPF